MIFCSALHLSVSPSRDKSFLIFLLFSSFSFYSRSIFSCWFSFYALFSWMVISLNFLFHLIRSSLLIVTFD
jgi:hypothetical protein